VGSGRVGEIEVELAGVRKSIYFKLLSSAEWAGPAHGMVERRHRTCQVQSSSGERDLHVAVQEMTGISETQRNNDVDTMLADSANVHMASTGDM